MKYEITNDNLIITYENHDIFKFNCQSLTYMNDTKNFKIKSDKKTVLNARLLQLSLPISEIDLTQSEIEVDNETMLVYKDCIPFYKGTISFLTSNKEYIEVCIESTSNAKSSINTALKTLYNTQNVQGLTLTSNQKFTDVVFCFTSILSAILESTALNLSKQIYADLNSIPKAELGTKDEEPTENNKVDEVNAETEQ